MAVQETTVRCDKPCAVTTRHPHSSSDHVTNNHAADDQPRTSHPPAIVFAEDPT
jgi:hypothetical protein